MIRERRRVETSICNAAPLRVTLRIEHGHIVLIVSIRKELAHSRVRETEGGLEITALHHLSFCHHLIAVLRPVHVWPKQSPQRVCGRKTVSRGDGKRSAGREMNPIEMTHQRNMRGRRTQCDLLRLFPIRIAWFAHAEFAVYLSCFQATRSFVQTKPHVSTDGSQSFVMLVLI